MADLNVPDRTFFEGDSAEIDRQMRHKSGIFSTSQSRYHIMPRIASIFDQDLIVLICAEAILLMFADLERADPAYAELAAQRARFLA